MVASSAPYDCLLLGSFLDISISSFFRYMTPLFDCRNTVGSSVFNLRIWKDFSPLVVLQNVILNIQDRINIYHLGDQNPNMVIISSDNFPWKLLTSEIPLDGQFPFATTTTTIFFTLSAHMQDTELSASPKELGLALNFVPQGGLLSGTVSHPNAFVFLQDLNFLTVKNSSITSWEKRSAFFPGTFPLLSIICIYLMRSAAFEQSPALPAGLRKSAILLQGWPLSIPSLKPPGMTFSSALGVQVVEVISRQSKTNWINSGNGLSPAFSAISPRRTQLSQLQMHFDPALQASFCSLISFSRSCGFRGNALLKVGDTPELCKRRSSTFISNFSISSKAGMQLPIL